MFRFKHFDAKKWHEVPLGLSSSSLRRSLAPQPLLVKYLNCRPPSTCWAFWVASMKARGKDEEIEVLYHLRSQICYNNSLVIMG